MAEIKRQLADLDRLLSLGWARRTLKAAATGLIFLTMILGTACSGDDQSATDSNSAASPSSGERQSATPATLTRSPSPAPTPPPTFTNADWPLVTANPTKYSGSNAIVTGRVFNIVPSSPSEFGFQIYTDVVNSDGNTVVVSQDLNLRQSVTEDVYVRVTGTLEAGSDYTNVAGGPVSAPLIIASLVEVVGRGEAIPAIKTVEVGSTVNQWGLAITLQRVEVAESETRIYVHILNGSNAESSHYTFDASLSQGTRTLDESGSYDTRALEPQSKLQPGTETTGIIVFQPADPVPGPLRFVWSGPSTRDYRLDFFDYVWDVNIP